MSIPIEYTQIGMPYLPYIELKVSNAFEENYETAKGEIDTGSPITVIRESFRQKIHANLAGQKVLGGFNSDPEEFRTCFVYVKIDSQKFDLLEVIRSEDELNPDVLIGRDLINLWKMMLDGERNEGKFDIWSTDPADVSNP